MAVYTPIDRAGLDRILAGYDLGEVLDFRPIPEGVENTNYELGTARGRFVLTLFERRVRIRDLPFFISLMEHLAGRGIPCPVPVPRRDGGRLSHYADRAALIVTFLPGRADPTAHRAIGGALADMHLAGAGFAPTRGNDLGPAGWRRLAASIGKEADRFAPGLHRRITGELDALLRHWPDNLPVGAIHADLFPDNAFIEDGRVTGIFDFYFACTDALAYDLAITQVAWAMDGDGRLDRAAMRELEAGYSRRRPLEPAERDALPCLRHGAALRFLLTRLHDALHPAPGALVSPKDPLEYLRKLDGLGRHVAEGPVGTR